MSNEKAMRHQSNIRSQNNFWKSFQKERTLVDDINLIPYINNETWKQFSKFGGEAKRQNASQTWAGNCPTYEKLTNSIIFG